VGFYSLAWGEPEHGFLLRHGVYTSIDYSDAFATNVRGINSEGDIVGLYTNNNDPDGWTEGPFLGFLLERNGTFTTTPLGNYNGINSRGEIVGGRGLLSGKLVTRFVIPGATSTNAWKITPDGQHIVGFYKDVDGYSHGFVLSRKP
jgi:uncharacterized membrane protein